MQASSWTKRVAPKPSAVPMRDKTSVRRELAWYLAFALLTTLAETMFVLSNISMAS